MSVGYRYPFTPYPSGWYRICLSDKICGDHHYLGGKVLIRRDGFGKAHATLNGRELPTEEHSGSVFVFFDEHGCPATFDVPIVQEFSDSKWLKPFHLNWRIRVHVQEIAENGIDVPHFDVVHRYAYIPKITALRFENHNFAISLASKHGICGIMVPTDTDICYHGLGVVISLVKSPAVNLRVLITTTPIDEEYVHVKMTTAIERRGFFRDALMRVVMPFEIHREFSRDLPVWENKAYHEIPRLCAEDAGIMKVRRWARQFYDTPEIAVLASQ